MGLLPSGLKLIIKLHQKYDFKGPVLTLGNQEIWATYEDLKKCFKKSKQSFKIPKKIVKHTSYMFDQSQVLTDFARDFVHAKIFFEMLGIAKYYDMDNSDNDRPTFQWDLNLPISTKYHQKFSLIFDGGTIEHIFDIKQVMTNIVKMLKMNGHIIHLSSFSMDHGFYGLSPTFFYDFYRQNGFNNFSCFIFQVDYRDILNQYKSAHPYFEYQYGMSLENMLDCQKSPLICFVAQKKQKLKKIMIPIQGIYDTDKNK